MTYETFKNSIVKRLHQDIPDPKKITIHTIEKNNNCMLDGLSIMEHDLNISPTIYLNYYYEEYLSGTPFSAVYDQMLHLYQLYKPQDKVDISFFTDYENVKNRLVYKLIHYERNRELLTRVPHIRFLDLAIVFYYLVITSENGCATILIHHQHLTLWQITQETLFQIASKNTPSLLPEELMPLPDIASELPPMFVLTNHYHLHGACCILYPNVLKQLAGHLDCDLCILPSSVHETILIPLTTGVSLPEFSSTVQEVNQSEVSPEEILSDHAYHYHLTDNQISF